MENAKFSRSFSRLMRTFSKDTFTCHRYFWFYYSVNPLYTDIRFQRILRPAWPLGFKMWAMVGILQFISRIDFMLPLLSEKKKKKKRKIIGVLLSCYSRAKKKKNLSEPIMKKVFVSSSPCYPFCPNVTEKMWLASRFVYTIEWLHVNQIYVIQC